MIALIACGASKLAHPAKARDLYTGALFQKSLRYAELRFYFATQSDRRHRTSSALVVSALHGILPMDVELAPYDVSLDDLSPDAYARWYRKVDGQLHEWTSKTSHVIVLAGRKYSAALLNMLADLDIETIEQPLGNRMIGERLQFLTQEIARLDALLPRLSDQHARSKR